MMKEYNELKPLVDGMLKSNKEKWPEKKYSVKQLNEDVERTSNMKIKPSKWVTLDELKEMYPPLPKDYKWDGVINVKAN